MQRSWLSHMLYASRSRHGVWRYRRAIPESLRTIAGRREYVVSLETRDDVEAAQRHAKVHLEAERQFKLWRAQESGSEVWTPEEQTWAKGVQFLKQNGMEYVPFERLKADHASQGHNDRQLSEFDQRLAFVDDRLGIDTYDEETRDEAVEASLKAKAVLGVLQPPVLRLSSALRLYMDEKAIDLSQMSERSAQSFRLERQRVINGLQKVLGDRPIEKITRPDAIAYRDHLVKDCQLTAATINKYIRIGHTIIETATTHHGLTMRNPFRSLRVLDVVADKDKRLPLTADEIKRLLACRESVNVEIGDILSLLICTGARLSEITGLETADVQIEHISEAPPYMWIRPNQTRALKTKSSRRKVPLIGPSLQAATDALVRSASVGQTEGPLFPRYGKNGGGDNASAALMKYLRRIGITDKKKVVHSIRHSVKQALRDVGCPKDVRDAIQGHSTGDVAETYGYGFQLETLRDWLEKAVKRLVS